ncbi:MAG: isochorismatase family protein [Haloarculaceae archaeon]
MTEQREQIYERAGMDDQFGYGDRPVVVAVDFQVGMTDPENPLGSELDAMVEANNRLVAAAHEADVPVVWTRVVYTHPEAADGGIWPQKIEPLKALQAGSRWVELDERCDVGPDDYVLEKKQASAFHETELHSMLTAWGVDTVIATGCTTSGCVRASVIDACANGFRVVVPEACVGDRSDEQHDANLYDMAAKYADVRPLEEVTAYLTERAAPVDAAASGDD